MVADGLIRQPSAVGRPSRIGGVQNQPPRRAPQRRHLPNVPQPRGVDLGVGQLRPVRRPRRPRLEVGAVGDLDQIAAPDQADVDVVVGVAVGHEGNRTSIGRERGLHLHPGKPGHRAEVQAGCRRRPQQPTPQRHQHRARQPAQQPSRHARPTWRSGCRVGGRRRLRARRLAQRDARVPDRLQPLARVLAQRASQQVAQPRRRGRRQPRPVGLGPHHRRQHVGDGLAREGGPSGQHLEEHAPEGPDISPPVHRLAFGLFRRHIGRRAQDHPRLRLHVAERGRIGQRRRRRRLRRQRLGQAKVQHLHLALAGELNVGRLQVAVNNAALVGVLDRLGELARQRHRLFQRQRPPPNALCQRLPLHQLHRQRAVLEAVHRRDPGMVQRRQRLRLPSEALHRRPILRQPRR